MMATSFHAGLNLLEGLGWPLEWTMKRVVIAFVLTVLMSMISTSVFADSVLVNIDLSGASNGDPIPTAPAGSNPVTAYTTVGGFATAPGTSKVGTVSGIGKAAVLTTDSADAEIGSLYLDTTLGFTVPHVSFSFDLDILSQAASGYEQTVDGGATPLLFGVRLYSPTISDWPVTFNVAPTSTSGGVFGFRNADNTALQTIGTYEVGTAQHVELDVNYAAGTVNAYLNGVSAGAAYPLRGGMTPNATTTEMFMYLNGSNGTSNQVAIGNVVIAAVPLPAAAWAGLALMGVVAGAKGWKGRRRSLTAESL
jgi:hypothetical protein